MTEFSRLATSRLASDLARPNVQVDAPLAVRLLASALVWIEMNKSALASLAISARRFRGIKTSRRTVIYDFYVRAVLLYLLAEFECDIQVYVLFFGDSADGAGVVSAVSGVDNDNKILRPDIACNQKRRNEQSQAEAYI